MRYSQRVVFGLAMLYLGGLPGLLSAADNAPALSMYSALDQFEDGSQLQATPIGDRQEVSIQLDSITTTATVDFPASTFIKLHADSIRLLGSDTLTVRASDGSYTHTLTSKNNSTAGVWLDSVLGSSVEISLRADNSGSSVSFDAYLRGFSTPELESAAEREESICGVDDRRELACYNVSRPDEVGLSSAVARLFFVRSGLGYVCTTWRVGPNNNTMMTNNHCIATASDLPGSEVWFNYQNTLCNGSDAYSNRVVVGISQVLTTDYVLDMTLFTIDNPASVAQFGSLALDNRNPVANEQIFIPQHPGGRDKELAVVSDIDGGNCIVHSPQTNGRGVGTDLSYNCDTEGGSSGSPVIAQSSKKVIGIHHFGVCNNRGVRIKNIYPLVSPYLMQERCNGLPVTVDIGAGQMPTPGNDVILGTALADTINGLGGDDTICSLGGDDKVYGGSGNDWIDAGDGDDLAKGNGGSDYLKGGDGDDQLFGNENSDRILGEKGNDTVYGGDKNDLIYGGWGDDLLYGGPGDDRIYGQQANDTIWGGLGDDLLFGQTGADFISGDDGKDEIDGGDKSDLIYGGAGPDKISGGDGNDRLFGQQSADVIYGDDGDDKLYGGQSDDDLYGGEGNDRLWGETGHDRLYGENGDDSWLDGGDHNDKIFGGPGNDVIRGGDGRDKVYGQGGNDDVRAQAGNDLVTDGGGGIDSCQVAPGIDTPAINCE